MLMLVQMFSETAVWTVEAELQVSAGKRCQINIEE